MMFLIQFLLKRYLRKVVSESKKFFYFCYIPQLNIHFLTSGSLTKVTEQPVPGSQTVGMSRKYQRFLHYFLLHTTALLFWSLEQARYRADAKVTSVISRSRKMMGKRLDLFCVLTHAASI